MPSESLEHEMLNSFFCRKDSDIVAPYEKWEYYDPRVKQMEQDRNYALNKTRKVAWFVSNCGARNGRLQYAHELQKHIQVSVYFIRLHITLEEIKINSWNVT